MEAGLTRIEARLYAELVGHGKSQAGELSRKTGIHRRNVYDALERLIKKGLVSFIKENNQRFYLPESPDCIKNIIEEKNAAIERILPELKMKFSEQKLKQQTMFYRGINGIKSILEDQIRTAKPVYIIGGERDIKTPLRFYATKYKQERIKQRIPLYIIFSGKKPDFNIPLAKIRTIARELSPVSTNIYGDNVAIITWTREPIAILIKSREIAKTYKTYFDIIWERARK